MLYLTSIFNNILATVGGNSNSETAVNIFQEGIQSAIAQTETWTQLWERTLGVGSGADYSGGQILFFVMVKIGLTAGAFVLVFMALNLVRSWTEGRDFDAYYQLIMAALVVALLANNGKLIADFSFGLRGFILTINEDVSTYALVGVDLEEAYKVEQYKQGFRQLATQSLRKCETLVGEAQEECLITESVYIKAQAQNILDANSWSGWFEKVLSGFVDDLLTLGLGAAGGLVGGPVGALAGASIGILVANWETILFSFLGMVSQAYLHALEITLLLTAYVGPVPVALSLLPYGTKPVFLWLLGFVTVGFNKICYTFVCGLAAYFSASTTQLDPMPMAFVFGFFAPVLSSGLALFGGMAIWRGLTAAMKESSETVAKIFI